MADESPGLVAVSSSKSSLHAPVPPPQGYGLLRWVIRLTGLLLMLAGIVYLVRTAFGLLPGKSPALDLTYVLLALGLGMVVLRTGFRILLVIDATTISQFSFIFALIYTFILLHIIPLAGIFQDYLVFTLILVVLYFSLSYLVLRRILSVLLLPSEKSSS